MFPGCYKHCSLVRLIYPGLAPEEVDLRPSLRPSFLALQLLDDVLDLLGIRRLWREPQIVLIVRDGAVVVASLNQSVRQIEVGDRVVGRRCYGAFIFLDRTFLVTLLTKQQSEIEMGFRITLLDIDRLLVFGDGAVGVTPIRQQDGIAIVRLGVGWVQTDSFFIVSFRRDWVALLL